MNAGHEASLFYTVTVTGFTFKVEIQWFKLIGWLVGWLVGHKDKLGGDFMPAATSKTVSFEFLSFYFCLEEKDSWIWIVSFGTSVQLLIIGYRKRFLEDVFCFEVF